MSSPRTNNALTSSLEEKIRVRAYELYQSRGAEPGRDLDDWLQAEAELLRSKVEAASANRVTPLQRARANTRRTSN